MGNDCVTCGPWAVHGVKQVPGQLDRNRVAALTLSWLVRRRLQKRLHCRCLSRKRKSGVFKAAQVHTEAKRSSNVSKKNGNRHALSRSNMTGKSGHGRAADERK